MILFRPEHVDPILRGIKTETRRGGKKRWRLGAIHQCRSGLEKAPEGARGIHATTWQFAKVKILSVERQKLRDMSTAEARAEGYDTVFEYWAAWERINGRDDLDEEVWVVRFELA